MAQISAAQVKRLRDRTGAGMMDCKKALSETDGDIEAAVDWLRKKGLSAAAKKAGRVAAEGLIGVKASGGHGALVEINAETDFVARNERFQSLVGVVAGLVANLPGDAGDLGALAAAVYPGGDRTVAEELTNLIATIGENMTLRRMSKLSVDNGVVASYVHGAVAPGLGRIGVLVALESTGDQGVLAKLGKQLAMHIAAASPQAVSRDDLDPAVAERERQVLRDQARESGKPENIIEKMVDGRMRKFFEEVTLLDQVFVVDNETKVAMVVENAAKDAGADIAVAGFVKYALGEGVEKADEDFAAEVAKLAG